MDALEEDGLQLRKETFTKTNVMTTVRYIALNSSRYQKLICTGLLSGAIGIQDRIRDKASVY